MSFDFQSFLNKYDVHPEVVSYFESRMSDGVKPYYEIGVAEARKASLKTAEKYAGRVDFDGTETEIIVPSNDVTDGIPVSVYKSKDCNQIDSPTIVVYFHGGGNVLGSRKTHETVCKTLARDASCIFVNVEYRLAPEHKFPAGNEDAYTVVDWVSKNKTAVGGTESSPLGVSGDSAGGRLAAVVSHELADRLAFSILVYPNVDFTKRRASFDEFSGGPILSDQVIKWFFENCISPSQFNTTRASPITNTDFSRLPPTLMIIAELDPLRDGCYDYIEKIKEAGRPIEVLALKGVTHAYWSLPAHFKECCSRSYTRAVEFIRKYSKK